MKITLLTGSPIPHDILWHRLLPALMLFGCITLHGQVYQTAQVSYAVKLGTTKPLYSAYAIPPTSQDKIRDIKKNKPVYVPNFFGRGPKPALHPNALPKGPDPAWQIPESREGEINIQPIVNFEALNENNGNVGVPDVNGDISPDYYVEIINATVFRVFNKMGQAVSLPISANAIWSQVGQTSAGDPILLYDQEADRWFLTEFAPVNQRRVLLAISETNDPRGSWTAYTFQTPRFPDFPKYGIWRDAYYLTTNEGGGDFPIYAFNRADMLAGEPVVRMQRLTVPKIGGVSFEVGQPIDWDGLMPPPEGSPGIVVKLNDDGWGTTAQDVIQLYKISINWDTASQSSIEQIAIPCTPYDTDGCQLESTGGFSCVPQPNNQGIDGAEWIITNKAQYRNFGSHESFVMSFMVDVTGDDVAGIRWVEFRKTDTEDWHIFQEGTVGSDDGLHRFMSSIGIDAQGTIGLAYSVSGFDKHPSLRYTGRYSTDPPGMMTFKEHEFRAGTGSRGSDRFGDYASMSVDPSDETTFWFAGQFVKSGGDWSTQIVAFAASRDSFDLLPVNLLSPVNSDSLKEDEELVVTILNRGLRDVDTFYVAYQFENGAWTEEQADVASLAVDETYEHTFQDALDFSGPGLYTLRIASNLFTDGNRQNDTLSFTITKYAVRDAALEYVMPTQQGIICSDETNATILIQNTGTETLDTIAFSLHVNQEEPVIIGWNGHLPFGDTEEFTFPVTGLGTGTSEVELDILSVNSDTDQVIVNHQLNWSYDANPDGHQVTLNLLTDNFPAETSWELTDSSGVTIAEDGPFADAQTWLTTPFCLVKEQCYTFTISDVFGDGMSSQGVMGDFEILNDEGDVLADLPFANFGAEYSADFCLTGACMLNIVAGTMPASSPGSQDGVAIISAENSLGEIRYSIDGGENFVTTPVFDQLAPGAYQVIAQDGAGCLDTLEFQISFCQLSIHISTLPAVGGDVGEIHVSVEGSSGSIGYSLNGAPFIADSFFLMLEPGEYTVTVRDSLGCEITDSVTVSTMVSVQTETAATALHIQPNPGKTFQIVATLPGAKHFVPYTVLSDDGIPVLYGSLVQYDNSHVGELSLVAYPPGTYFLLIKTGTYHLVKKVIRVE